MMSFTAVAHTWGNVSHWAESAHGFKGKVCSARALNVSWGSARYGIKQAQHQDLDSFFGVMLEIVDFFLYNPCVFQSGQNDSFNFFL